MLSYRTRNDYKKKTTHNSFRAKRKKKTEKERENSIVLKVSSIFVLDPTRENTDVLCNCAFMQSTVRNSIFKRRILAHNCWDTTDVE